MDEIKDLIEMVASACKLGLVIMAYILIMIAIAKCTAAIWVWVF